jgi:uncharacterized membrane protein
MPLTEVDLAENSGLPDDAVRIHACRRQLLTASELRRPFGRIGQALSFLHGCCPIMLMTWRSDLHLLDWHRLDAKQRHSEEDVSGRQTAQFSGTRAREIGSLVGKDGTPELTPQDETSRSTKPEPGPRSAGHFSTPPGLASVLARNIRMVEKRRNRDEAAASFEERFAAGITRFTGSMRFVYLHLFVFGFWILINLGTVPTIPKFDPTFAILAMAASVEAIFLSTFILISQNRMAAVADRRADLDLQINLLAEHEVTKLVALMSAVAAEVGARVEIDPEVMEELKQDVAPEAVLDEIEGKKKSYQQRA